MKKKLGKMLLVFALCLTVIIIPMANVIADDKPTGNLNGITLVNGLKMSCNYQNVIEKANESKLKIPLGEAGFGTFDGTGFALRIANPTKTMRPFNIEFHEVVYEGINDFEIWTTARHGAPGENTKFIAISVDGTEKEIDTYYGSGLYIPAGFDGTVFVPYSLLVRAYTAGDTQALGYNQFCAYISVMYLSINSYFESGAVFLISEIADYDDNGMQTILNFSAMTETEFKPITKLDSEQGTVVMRSDDDSVKVMTAERVQLSDVFIKSSFDKPNIGDVRVLEDFNVPSGMTEQADIDIYCANTFSSWTGGYNIETRLVDNPNPSYKYGKMLSYKPVAKAGMGENPFGSLTITERSFVNNWSDWADAKGITFYVKNVNQIEMGMNVEFDEYNFAKNDNAEYWERWTLDALQRRIYLYDANTDKEYVVLTKSVFYIPVGFEGWVRIPFTSYLPASWTVTNGYIDFNNKFTGFHITSHGGLNDGLTFLIDNLGVYTKEFRTGMLFNADTTNTIKSNLGK